MGCGQSVNSAYSNRRTMPGRRTQPWAQPVGGTGQLPKEPIEEPVVERKLLEQYLQIEREIAQEQQANPQVLQQYKAKMAALEQAGRREEQLETQLATDPGQAEAAKAELHDVQGQKHALQQEVAELKESVETLEVLHLHQDELLAKIFGGGHGSKREIELEQELDILESRRARIMEANFKWRQAQMMMEYACRQLAVAVQKWQDLPDIPTIELEIRYTMPTEIRQNMIETPHNISTAQQHDSVANYIGNNNSLNQDVESVFETPNNDDPEKARERLQQNHQKASSLLRWFEQVLNTTIMQDLAAINRQVRQTTLELKEERVRLIKQKVKEIWGTDVHVEIEDDGSDEVAMSLQGLSDEEIMKTFESTDYMDRMTPPMNIDELNPMPTNEELFGKSYEEFKKELDNMREEHEMEMSLFLREQDKQAAKARGDLQAKLEARRRDRAMRNLETKQRQVLATGASVS
ncbi:uncharacterized protein LOC119113212 [Pollicipes pollicipes]|uniref:uncharacterized protein LOC119113212 n=1 Tax=Pollicipes pollicipes TaxID=41117 RepID=UPI00188526F8|nr:uncharacterized protein LOC119113212 [Pollicipes pollicipes]